MRVSLVVPMYNSEKIIEKSINSIIKQTVVPFEVIIIDDGSTDNSFDIAKELTKDAKYFKVIKKQNGGVSSARNYGTRIASGDYIMFMDSDDILCDDTIESVERIIEANNRPDFIKFSYITKCSFWSKKYNFSIKQLCSVIYREKYRDEIIPNLLSTNDFSAVWNIAIKAEVAKTTLFDETKKYGEDRKYNADLINKSKTILIDPKPLYIYRITDGSAMRSNSQERALRQLKDVLETNNYIYRLFDALKLESFKRSASLDLKNYIIMTASKLNYKTYVIAQNKLKDCIKGLKLNKEIRESLIYDIELETIRKNYKRNKIQGILRNLRVRIRSVIV